MLFCVLDVGGKAACWQAAGSKELVAGFADRPGVDPRRVAAVLFDSSGPALGRDYGVAFFSHAVCLELVQPRMAWAKSITRMSSMITVLVP